MSVYISLTTKFSVHKPIGGPVYTQVMPHRSAAVRRKSNIVSGASDQHVRGVSWAFDEPCTERITNHITAWVQIVHVPAAYYTVLL